MARRFLCSRASGIIPCERHHHYGTSSQADLISARSSSKDWGAISPDYKAMISAFSSSSIRGIHNGAHAAGCRGRALFNVRGTNREGLGKFADARGSRVARISASMAVVVDPVCR